MNTRDYFEKYYSRPDWRVGWDWADLRLSQAMELVNERYAKHLDVGCANGGFTKNYLAKFPDTEGWGIEIAEAAVNLAKDNCPQGNFLQGDAYELPFPDETFNMVHSAEVLEHLEYPEKALEEMYRVLVPGGTLIITIPNETADDYEEHLWAWDIRGIRKMIRSRMDKAKLDRFVIIDEHRRFHNGHIYYVRCQKQ